jgi:hypothetical protein
MNAHERALARESMHVDLAYLTLAPRTAFAATIPTNVAASDTTTLAIT